MDSSTIIGVASIVTAGLTTGIGCMMPALGEGRSVSSALNAIAQQPDASSTITRTLFVGLAMIESTAIYCYYSKQRIGTKKNIREDGYDRIKEIKDKLSGLFSLE